MELTMQLRELKDALERKAENMMKLADALGEKGKSLSDSQRKSIRQVQADMIADGVQEMVTIWASTGDDDYLGNVKRVVEYNTTIE